MVSRMTRPCRRAVRSRGEGTVQWWRGRSQQLAHRPEGSASQGPALVFA